MGKWLHQFWLMVVSIKEKITIHHQSTSSVSDVSWFLCMLCIRISVYFLSHTHFCIRNSVQCLSQNHFCTGETERQRVTQSHTQSPTQSLTQSLTQSPTQSPTHSPTQSLTQSHTESHRDRDWLPGGINSLIPPGSNCSLGGLMDPQGSRGWFC